MCSYKKNQKKNKNIVQALVIITILYKIKII